MSMYHCIYGDKAISNSIFCVINYSDEWIHDTANDRLWKFSVEKNPNGGENLSRLIKQTLPLGPFAFENELHSTSFAGHDGGSMTQLLITFNDLHMWRLHRMESGWNQ